MTLRRSIMLPMLLCLCLALAPAQAREVIDMAGRTVTVPEHVHGIYAMSHSLAIVTALAPDLLVGLPFPFKRNPEAERYLPARYAKIGRAHV